MFSLLPGYNSRPHPSPEKARKQHRTEAPSGGFVAPRSSSDLQSKHHETNVLSKDRLHSSRRTSLTSSIPSQASSNPSLGSIDATIPDRPSVLPPPRHPTDTESHQELVVQGDRYEDPVLALKQNAADRNQPGRGPQGQMRDRQKENELWAELANELHASTERRNNAHIFPELPRLADPAKSPESQGKDQATRANKEKQRLERIDLRARNALLAHAGENLPYVWSLQSECLHIGSVFLLTNTQLSCPYLGCCMDFLISSTVYKFITADMMEYCTNTFSSKEKTI